MNTGALKTLPLIAGEEYVAALSARCDDRRARAAFLDRAVAGLAPGASIFDFGCGPGVDAQFYVERGFRVFAYDVDPNMCAAFLTRCESHISHGRARLLQSSYPEFIASSFANGEIDLVTANFAPLNVIDDLAALFARFHSLTRPGARVLVSMLNPSCVSDMRYRWWWRHRLEYLLTGHFAMRGAAYLLHRRSSANLAVQAHPYFRLQGVFRGLPEGWPARIPLLRRLSRLTSQFLFFELERL